MKSKYIGITPYDEEQQFDFVGREEETWALYDRISRNDYTVYYAASGEGKSSLIRAGLLPILRRREYYPIYIVLDDHELKDETSIAKIIDRRINNEEKKYKNTYEEITYVQSNRSKTYLEKEKIDKDTVDALSGNLWWKFRNYCFKRRNGTELTPLFIFDQFEEVFAKTNYAWTDAFFEWLEEISTDYVPDSLTNSIDIKGLNIPTQKNFKVLFSFRTEYLGELDYWCVQKHFIPALQENRMCLKPLTHKGAREVVNLNADILGVYADDIINGCSVADVNTDKEKQPSVYALILSVVCQVLSELSETERKALLEDLNKNRDNVIDKLLLVFYKKKLKDAGLDYVKDEKLIADIEDALISGNGKRNRRDTGDPIISPLSEWIEKLYNKENGLIKVIGTKEVNGKTVNVIEFPHDRLCKAIDTARKERQQRLAEKYNRQNEWMQFGILSFVFGIVMYVISKNFASLFKFIHLLFKDSTSIKDIISPSENMSTVVLLILLAIFTPVLTILYSYGNKRKNISICVSLLSTVSFGVLSFYNRSIEFENKYIPFITFVCFVISCFLSYLFYKSSFSKNIVKLKYRSKETVRKQSYWPVWGAFLIVAVYAFYLSVYDYTIGINDPRDSFWGLFTLPFFYSLFTRGFFHVETNWKSREAYILLSGFLALLLLGGFFAYSHWTILHIGYWQRYGTFLSVFLIIIFLVSFILSLWLSDSDSIFYKLTTNKRILLSVGCVLVTIATYFVNLGYNPFAIPVGKVAIVHSWRTVLVCEHLDGKNLYGVFSANGDTIIPCCMDWGINDSTIMNNDSVRLSTGYYKIIVKNRINPFENDSTANEDSTLIWSKQNNTLGTITGKILSSPALEERLYSTISKKLSSNSTLEDSINYYSSRLFVEIRAANIKWLLKGHKYGLESLPSLAILEKKQLRYLEKVIKDFSQKQDPMNRKIEYIMTDQDLVDLGCNIVRSMLLSSIKERCRHQDMSQMFALHPTLCFAFFHSTPNLKMVLSANMNCTSEMIINGKSSLFSLPYKMEIYSEDVFNRRTFAWYDMFLSLCIKEMNYNSRIYEEMYLKTDSVIKILNSASAALDDVVALHMFMNGENNLKLSVNEMVDLITTAFNLAHPDYWQSKKNKMDVDIRLPSYINEDEQFARLKELVCGELLFVLQKRPTGVYNNYLENICRYMIIVSAHRGYNVSSDVDKLIKYKEDSWKLLSQVKELDNVRVEASKALTRNKEIVDVLDSIIYKLRNKQMTSKSK